MRPSDLAAIAAIRADLRSGAAKRAREATGLSRQEVAESIGVTRQTVWLWERETNPKVPSDEHALAYARALAYVRARLPAA